MEYPVAQIAVEHAAYAYDKPYTYLLPPDLVGEVQPGCRVTVPFGGGNRRRTGLVLELGLAAERGKLKPITAVLDREPLLDDEGMMLLRYLHENTFCTWFDALRPLLPAGAGVVYRVWYSMGPVPPAGELTPRQADILAWLAGKRKGAEQAVLCEQLGLDARDPELLALVESGAVARSERTGRRVQDDKVTMVRRTGESPTGKLTPKQRLVMDFLEGAEAASLKEICYYTGVTRSVVDTLQTRGQVEYFDVTRPRSPFREEATPAAPRTLSPAQQAALDELRGFTKEERPAPALLYGVTGSGKTEVFLALIGEVLAGGRTALVLVPEISLTAQTVEVFRSRFGERVAVLHSALSLGERMDEWKRIRSGEAVLVVGTRSAVFAPLQNLGLLVIDEEQEHTYHSDQTPRFHAREVALRRCARHGALLLLSSATPSIESYYAARQGRYRLVKLAERFTGARLPDVYTVDMRDSANLSQNPAFSQRLLEELRYNLERGEQSILLLNRRGHSTVVKCSSCGVAADCPNCSVSLTYHAANDNLLCHYCGYTRHKAATCEHCGSSLIRYSGAGTQKLEEELRALFPQARILRVDMDTTMAKFSHERLFGAFAAHEYDMMIGTQMVAKGLNFPDVTLVGVLMADQALYAGDFRSYERSFSLLTQVVGRSGRGEKRGRAFVQTYSPENPVIQLAATQDYETFYRQEIGSRKLHLYPPFCAMAGIGFVGENLEEVTRWSGEFLRKFKEQAKTAYPNLPIRALGPVAADVLKAAGKYRYKLLLKCRNTADTRALLRGVLEWFYRECRTVSVFIDMHGDRL